MLVIPTADSPQRRVSERDGFYTRLWECDTHTHTHTSTNIYHLQPTGKLNCNSYLILPYCGGYSIEYFITVSKCWFWSVIYLTNIFPLLKRIITENLHKRWVNCVSIQCSDKGITNFHVWTFIWAHWWRICPSQDKRRKKMNIGKIGDVQLYFWSLLF